MKNLFDYATKELSQDAFLRWLFENYDDPELGEIVNRLSGKLCGFCEGEKVKTLRTEAQNHKIDISVWITTTAGRKYALFLEDKAFSSEHNQLKAYDRFIDYVAGQREYTVRKVFYKTAKIEDDERDRICEAAKNGSTRWEIFDINEISDFFSPYLHAQNIILRQYAEHVKNIYEATTNTQKPKSNDGNVDYAAWKSYFEKVIIPAVEKDGSDEYKCSSWRAGQYPYVVLYVKKRGYGDRIPYLEIRSRDCLDDKFMARILCYGMEEKDIPQQNILIENIKATPELECKNLRTRKKGKEIDFPKQVGKSLENLTASTDEEFIELVKKHIAYYLHVMKDWK